MGERKLSKVLGEKFDNEKPRFSLLPKGVLSKVITVLEIGSKKYQKDNWQHVEGAKTRYFDALHRHVDAWWSGERNDPETGQHHLAHAVCCAMFLMWFDDTEKENTIVVEGYRAHTLIVHSYILENFKNGYKNLRSGTSYEGTWKHSTGMIFKSYGVGENLDGQTRVLGCVDEVACDYSVDNFFNHFTEIAPPEPSPT